MARSRPHGIVADRFWRGPDGRYVDLATGQAAIINWRHPAAVGEQTQWDERCTALLGIGPRRSLRLADYGWDHAGRRFEAWEISRVGRRGNGRPVSADPAGDSVTGHHGVGETGDERLVRRLAAFLDEPGLGLRALRIRTGTDDHLPATLARVARQARLGGYLPVRASLLDKLPGLRHALSSRHLLLIDDADSPSPAGRDTLTVVLLRCGVESVRAHRLLLVSPSPREAGFPVVEKLAPYGARSASAAVCVRESAASFGVTRAEIAARPPVDRAGQTRQTRPRSLAAHALDLLERRRPAAAERSLRAALQAFLRRGRTGEAAEVALALGRLLLHRGRVREAADAFMAARAGFEQAGTTGELISATTLLGLAWTDAGRLAESEAALRAATVAALRLGEPRFLSRPVAGLVRCLIWQGRHVEAEIELRRLVAASGPDRVRQHRLAARLARARYDTTRAGREARLALEAAHGLGDLVALAGAHASVAEVCGDSGDGSGLQFHCRAAIEAARSARAPLLALRARIVLVRGFVRLARPVEAKGEGRRLARRWLGSLPPLLRARAQLALIEAAIDDDGSARRAVRGFVRASGARALDPTPAKETSMDMIREVIDILRLCQDTTDERQALTGTCGRVRDQLRASATYLCARAVGERPIATVGAASASGSPLVLRVMETGLPLAPVSSSDGYEAAAPVRYGGATIGALGCRWSLDGPADPERVATLLSAAATACAPRLQEAVDRLAAPPAGSPGGRALIGESLLIEEVRRAIRRAAAAPFAVLIQGESGSGKELVARAIHRDGPRRDSGFAALNCAALTDDLVEAELFGHARGAFTGALAERPGLFEEAAGGTLFLDEITELSPRAQAKLLRAIQEGEIRRVGENFSRRVDVRLIAATNRSLHDEVTAGRFRRDLLYRIDVIRILVPPLRERAEDIPALALHFWADAAARVGSRATLDPATLAALARHEWPGNVRELQNVIAALAVASPRRGRIGPDRLPDALARTLATPASTLEDARRIFERRLVSSTLARTGGHRGRAAADLGLSRQGFTKLLSRLGLESAGKPPPNRDDAARSGPSSRHQVP